MSETKDFVNRLTDGELKKLLMIWVIGFAGFIQGYTAKGELTSLFGRFRSLE